MNTRTTMLSSLAIAALATVTLNSTEALAKSGGSGGSSGMRSFSAAARTPIVVNKIAAIIKSPKTPPILTGRGGIPTGTGPIPTPRPPVLGKLATTVAQERSKPNPTTTDVRSPYQRLPDGSYLLSNPQLLPSSLGKSVGDAIKDQLKQLPPVATPLPGGTPPVVTLPPNLPPIKPPSSPPIILPPPVVVNPPAPPVVVTPPAPVSVGFGVAATELIEPAGCTYERSVRKLPGGGLQRVIIKVCPDVIVQ